MKININGGESKKLLTGGKYCPEDILVTAEGGGEAAVQRMKRFVLDLSEVTAAAGTLAPSFWPGKTFYGTVNNSSATWQGFEGKTVQSQYSASEAVGRYMTDEIKNNTVIYVTGYTSTVLNIQRIDLGSLASAPKSCLEDYEGELPPGTYEFAEGQIYYYTYGESSGRHSVIEKDVNFYDYDGTLLHSYTLGEVQTLSELPPLPQRAGLICQEWNWTLDELKALGRPMTVGASYITDDGATRLYLDIPNDGRKTVPLHFSQSVSGGVTINWGDGSAAETVSGTGYISTSHTYANGGEYMISLMPSDTCNIILGNGTNTSVIGATASDTSYFIGSLLASANIGKNVSLGKCAFEASNALKKISMPSTTRVGTALYECNAFERCLALNFVVFSRANTFLGAYCFQHSCGLDFVSLAPTISGTIEGAFAYCRGVKRLDFPDGIENITWNGCRDCCSLNDINKSNATRIDESAFRGAWGLKRAVIGEGQKSINQTFNGAYSLADVDIPSTITTLSGSGFSNCLAMRKYDFTKLTAIPTLSSTDVFTGIPSDCIIVVPDSLVAQWKTATNWSTYASHIKGASEV